MATKSTNQNEERQCPWCAETIKSAALICKHCKREVSPANDKPLAETDATVSDATTDSVPPTEQQPVFVPTVAKPGMTQRVLAIILFVFAGLTLLIGDMTILKLLFLVALPIGIAAWLLAKSKKLAERSSSTPDDASTAKTSAQSATTAVSSFALSATKKSKKFFGVKKNLYVTLGAIAVVLALIIGISIKADSDERAAIAEATAVQEKLEKEQAAQDLSDATAEAESALASAQTRYDESVAWSNETDRTTLSEAITELKNAIKLKKLEEILTSTESLASAYALVGTQAEATAKAEAAAKEAAAKAEADRIAAQTISQKNAIQKARDYLRSMAFSRQGLIDQLIFEGYSAEDSTYAVDEVHPDWNTQAAKKAKNYLDTMPFSRQSLIDQLLFEGFSQSEAEFGVSQNGY